jgi:hypothetical protein
MVRAVKIGLLLLFDLLNRQSPRGYASCEYRIYKDMERKSKVIIGAVLDMPYWSEKNSNWIFPVSNIWYTMSIIDAHFRRWCDGRSTHR